MRSVISGRAHDVRSESSGQLWLPCANGIRAGVYVLGLMVERCVSSLRLRLFSQHDRNRENRNCSKLGL